MAIIFEYLKLFFNKWRVDTLYLFTRPIYILINNVSQLNLNFELAGT